MTSGDEVARTDVRVVNAVPPLDTGGVAESPAEVPARRFRQFMLDHWLICALLAAAALVRLIVMLAYPPAFWFSDSVAYVHSAVAARPDLIRPAGYSFLLILLKPFHSFYLVAVVQHFMGLAMGAEVYALLRHRKLPAWGSALATIPALFSSTALQIEHYVLSDTFFGFLVTSALVMLLWRPRPRLWVCLVVGLLLAWSVVARVQGILLIVPFILYLATARLGWRRFLIGVLALAAAGLIPVAAYAWWFDQSHGSYQLTTSSGAFLYSRVAPFEQCSIVRPPRDEQFLCIDSPVSERHDSSWYVFQPGSPLSRGSGQRFDSQVNRLATDFALRTIAAQPASYLRVVWDASVEAFGPAGGGIGAPQAYQFKDSVRALTRYELAVRRYDRGVKPRTRVIQPFAGWLLTYQRFLRLPGPLLGFIVVLGLLGIVLGWRRRSGRQALVAWLTGALLIVTPAATAAYDARYVVAAVPAFCIAGALGVRETYLARRSLRDTEHDSQSLGTPDTGTDDPPGSPSGS